MIDLTSTMHIKARSLRWAAALGPGLIVMMADTDAGSIITAAQSGAQWGYRLLALQIILIPILYMVQELTVRLGLLTGRGHGELILWRFGRGWAWLSVSTLVIACIGALVTELSGMAGVGAMFGVPVWLTMALTVGTLVTVVWTGSYRSVEGVALALGAFELVFFWIAFRSGPHAGRLVDGLIHIPMHDSNYLYLATANIGAVIMPWMVFYQQSAVIEKGMTRAHLKIARWETAIGAILTQLVMAAVLIAVAATIGTSNPNAPLDTVQEISDSLVPFLGPDVGRVVFALGMSGAALVAAIVVSLTAAWGIGEVTGYRRSLADQPKEAPWFYGIFTATLVLGGLLVMSGINLVKLSVAVEVLNALLLPIVLGFLFALARMALPEESRLKGVYAWVVGVVILVTAGFGIYAGFSQL
jgi:NRAMP (natural resistance-associated macrophage protein)-like metal ion transporter